MIRQLATSSENLVASTQFLVALATSESQFQARTFNLQRIIVLIVIYINELSCKNFNVTLTMAEEDV